MMQLNICLSFFIVSAYGSGDLTVLHHPKSLIFKGHDHVKESVLNEVYSASLGFSTQQYSNWDGLYIEDPFNLPEAIVTVAIDGVSNINYAKGHHFPTRTDQDEFDVYSSLERRISERYPGGSNNMVRIELANGLKELEKYSIFKGIKSKGLNVKEMSYKHLSGNVDEQREFLEEIALFNAVLESVEHHFVKKDNVPDVFWFKISTLHALVDLYGDNSTQVKEAGQLINDALVRLNTVFNKAYNGKVLISILTSDATHTRRTRSILAAETSEPSLNLAKKYGQDYPVIFNIILWFGVAMFFALLAICIAIATMDPGRDSIIYRMTSTRMKKDN